MTLLWNVAVAETDPFKTKQNNSLAGVQLVLQYSFHFYIQWSKSLRTVLLTATYEGMVDNSH